MAKLTHSRVNRFESRLTPTKADDFITTPVYLRSIQAAAPAAGSPDFDADSSSAAKFLESQARNVKNIALATKSKIPRIEASSQTLKDVNKDDMLVCIAACASGDCASWSTGGVPHPPAT